jgi:gluconokinase
MTAFIIMGVSGAGKTSVGRAVSDKLGLAFFEGDDYHPPENIAKMSSGIPLTDQDRAPWIDALVAALNARAGGDAIVACSALSRFVRQRLRAGVRDPVEFVLLITDPAIIEDRLRKRGEHYMKAGMLASQFAALQMPEDAHRIDVSQPLDAVVRQVLSIVESKGLNRPSPTAC